MKKKYLPKAEKPKVIIRGAYDKDNDWWFEEDIQRFTGGVIKMCFGKSREKVEIIERVLTRKEINDRRKKKNT